MKFKFKILKTLWNLSLLFILMFMSSYQAVSQGNQQRSIRGKVVDEQQSPLPGVTVVVKGTTQGIVTSGDGNYSISNVPADATLIFSFVGMKTQEIAVGSQSNINVSMAVETVGLEEVVAVGYGTMKKSDLTGSVATVNQEAMKTIPVLTIDQKLIGQMAGVQIQQVSGAPGAGTSVKIRGAGSLGAGNEPLYVVDGVPYSSGMNQNMNPLVFLNPNDIESVSVLKDASSTAIYGSRGANGVIMITTKQGHYNISEVTVSAMTGFQEVPQKGRLNMMNAREYAEYQRELISIRVRAAEKREPTETDFPVEFQNPGQITGGTDWYNLIMQVAPIQEYNVRVNKGTEDSKMSLSLGYSNQEGVLKYSGVKRYSAILSMETKMGKSFTVGASLLPSFIVQNRAFTNTGRQDVIGLAGSLSPIMKPYDENGNLIPYLTSPTNKYVRTLSAPNPLFLLKERKETQNSFKNIGTAFVEWEIIPDLKVRSAFNTTWSFNDYFYYKPNTLGDFNKAPAPNTGNSVTNKNRDFDWLSENTINYRKKINEHHFQALLGFTAEKYTSQGINLTASPYPNDLITTINAAQAISNWDAGVNEWSLISYLGRFNYTYKDRYLLTATLRSDGSSRFGANNRFVLFPSVAAAWIMSDEAFLKNSKVIDQMKLRASYGKSGNNNIGNYASMGSINSGTYVLGSSLFSATSLGSSNPDLKWEESVEYDAGIDVVFFKNRLSATVDFYNRKSTNMLLNNIIPAITGFNNQTVNKGNVRNRGLEIALGGTPVKGDIRWDINLNISINRNKVISMNDNNDPILGGNFWGLPTNITMVGKPIGQLYGLVWEGLLTAADMANPKVPKDNMAYEGSNKYKDVNGDGAITGLPDYNIIGNPWPDFIFGVSNSVSYKNFNLSMTLQGQYGGNVVDGMHGTTDNLAGMTNLSKEWVNRWHSAADPGDGKHCGLGTTEGWAWKINSLFIEDASYLRISNLRFAYTIPKNWVSFIKNCDVYASIQNLAMFTNYHGANPEGQNSNINNTLAPGYDHTSYPLARTTSFGIVMSF